MTKQKSAIISLDCPVQLADRLLTEVTMRRPTVGDLIDHPIRDVQDMKGELRLYAWLCNLSEEDLRLLDMEDYAKIQRQYLFFRGITDAQGTDAPGADSEPSNALGLK